MSKLHKFMNWMEDQRISNLPGQLEFLERIHSNTVSG